MTRSIEAAMTLSHIFGTSVGVGRCPFAALHHCLGILSALRLFGPCILVDLPCMHPNVRSNELTAVHRTHAMYPRSLNLSFSACLLPHNLMGRNEMRYGTCIEVAAEANIV
jgi:hypothetical protein